MLHGFRPLCRVASDQHKFFRRRWASSSRSAARLEAAFKENGIEFKENGIEFADASPGLILVPGSISRTPHARSACGGWLTLSDPDGGLAPRHSAHALLNPVVGALV